jgi:hypothetical protein
MQYKLWFLLFYNGYIFKRKANFSVFKLAPWLIGDNMSIYKQVINDV